MSQHSSKFGCWGPLWPVCPAPIYRGFILRVALSIGVRKLDGVRPDVISAALELMWCVQTQSVLSYRNSANPKSCLLYFGQHEVRLDPNSCCLVKGFVHQTLKKVSHIIDKEVKPEHCILAVQVPSKPNTHQILTNSNQISLEQWCWIKVGQTCSFVRAPYTSSGFHVG